jgi:hypothetical protein
MEVPGSSQYKHTRLGISLLECEPMYIQTFEYIVRSSILKWFDSLVAF